MFDWSAVLDGPGKMTDALDDEESRAGTSLMGLKRAKS
jgi:hypothetical protein